MVDICREGLSQRLAPQKRHLAHLRRHAHCIPRKLSHWDGGGDKMQPPIGGDCAHQAPGHLSCSDLGRAQNAGPTKSAPLRTSQVPEPERLRPGECIQARASLSSWQSNLEPKQCRQGKHTCHERGKPIVAGTPPTHASVICLQCSSLPTA